jgi:hypothetical protein
VNAIKEKIKPVKVSRIELGDVVTFLSYEPFRKGATAWGTIVELVDRGSTGQHMLCGIQWFNKLPGKRGHMSYHYANKLVRLDEKLSYDAIFVPASDAKKSKA